LAISAAIFLAVLVILSIASLLHTKFKTFLEALRGEERMRSNSRSSGGGIRR
jgi:hypothetical protein